MIDWPTTTTASRPAWPRGRVAQLTVELDQGCVVAVADVPVDHLHGLVRYDPRQLAHLTRTGREAVQALDVAEVAQLER